jgi:hypothetical protein
METEPRAAAVLANTLARQAAALHVVFMRTFADVLSNKENSLRNVSRALQSPGPMPHSASAPDQAPRGGSNRRKNRENRTNELMKGEIALYDQQLTKASVGPDLWSRQPAPLKLDIGYAVKKIANFDEQTIGRRNCLA